MSVQDVKNLIACFANSFDLKDWGGLGAILADQIECDYSDFRGDVTTCKKEDYVSLREEALQPLKTQHLFSNFEIELKGNTANCRASALILRRNNEGISFDTHALYDFRLKKINNAWNIVKIKQMVLWHDGNPTIHSGSRQK